MKSLYCLLFLAVAVSAHDCESYEGHTHKRHTQEDATHEDHTHDAQNYDHDPHPLHAAVLLEGGNVRGVITLSQKADNVLIEGKVTGMPPGKYGLTIYEYGDITNGCNSTGAHFNPDKNDHGHPCDKTRHAGDLGNVEFDDKNTANIHIHDHIVAFHGKYNVIGRALVLHSQPDDHGHTEHPDSKKFGNAGDRVACGVIGILGD